MAAQDRGVMDRLTPDNLKSMLGTISVEAQPNFVGGQLDGCSIGFNVLAQDWAYKQGAYIKVSGTFGLMSARQGGVVVVLEVIVHDIDARTGMPRQVHQPAHISYQATPQPKMLSSAVIHRTYRVRFLLCPSWNPLFQ
jgi:hypothetical protein